MNDKLLKENKLLRDQIEKLRNERKFGLVWEDTIEDNETADYAVTLDRDLSINLTTDAVHTTEHLLFEGDNLLSLRELQKTHKEKIDVIYIDPPYNTGNKFVYNDKLKSEQGVYSHSAWLSFMEKRLSLAKNLLSNDGVIFVSIDDNEQAQLKLLMDKIFGESNYIENIMWLHGKGKKTKQTRTLQQYTLVYAKNKEKLGEWKEKVMPNYDFKNIDNDEKGEWFSGSISFSESRSNKEHPNYYTVISPSGVKWERQWLVSKEEMNELIENGDIYFGEKPHYSNVPRKKIRKKPIDVIPKNIIEGKGTTKSAEKDLENILGKNKFNYPKPVELIKHFIKIIEKNSNIKVLDFFAGSGTTGHAVMELNKEDGGNRQFILCTNNEVSEEKEREYLATKGYIEKPQKQLYNKFKKEQPEQYETFLNSEDYQSLGIARSVTRERLKRVIEGYTTPKGKEVEGLGDNKVKYYTFERN